MTSEELAEIEARANAATPGPWETHVTYCVITLRYGDDGYLVADCGTSESPDCCEGNAPFIAHARTDVPALVAEVRRLAAEVERLRAELADAQATIANERGEGEPPEPGFVFANNGGERSTWCRVDGPVGAYVTREITDMGRVRWRWSVIEDRYGLDESPRLRYVAHGYAPTARSAMRAALAALPSQPETP